MKLADLKEVAKGLGRPVDTIRGYLRQRLLIWHKKDEKTGVKVLFYWPCVQVRQHFINVFHDNKKNNSQIADAFKQVFGEKDKHLIDFLENHHSTEQAITSFRKNFTDRGLL
jgi:hypothetical protein